MSEACVTVVTPVPLVRPAAIGREVPPCGDASDAEAFVRFVASDPLGQHALDVQHVRFSPLRT